MSTTSSCAQNSTSGAGCESTLAKSATGNGAPKFNIRSKKNQLRLKQLMQRKPVSYSMQALHVEVLRPLVDLAYSSTFAEVRRDTAAAFATLSFNDSNLDILAGAGALGALLALVDLNTKDVASIRDAAIALAQMVKRPYLRDRLMQAPTGLGRVFELLQCSNVSLKSTALQLLHRLCTTVQSQQAVIKVGGLAIIFQELQCHDDNIRAATAALISQFTSGTIPKEQIVDMDAVHICIAMMEGGALKSFGTNNGTNTRDLGVERCLIEYLTSICSVKPMKVELVRMGVATQLLQVLDVDGLPGPYVLLVVRAMHELVQFVDNHPHILADGLLVRLARICFGTLIKRTGSRAAGRSSRKSMKMGDTEGGATHTSMAMTSGSSLAQTQGGLFGHDSSEKKKRGRNLQHEVKRVSLSIFKSLAHVEDNHDTMLRSGILAYMLNDASLDDTLREDRRLGRLISDVIDRIATYARRSYARNQTFIAQGAVDYVERFLESDDTRQRTNALCFLASYVDSSVVEHLIYDARTAQILVDKCMRPEACLMPPLIVLRKLVEEVDWRAIVVSVGAVPPLVAMIKRSHRSYEEVYRVALEVLHALSSFEGSLLQMVDHGAIGFLLNLARHEEHDDDVTQLAKQLLFNLGRDTAATMIQKVAKTFIVKRRLVTVRARIKGQLVMPDIKSIKESTKFPMITLKH